MSAREEFARGYEAADDRPLSQAITEAATGGRSGARARVHAMFTLTEETAAELDKRLDAVRAEVLDEEELLPKADVVAWLVKKDRECTPVWQLASKAERGAIRPDNLRTLPPDFFEPGHVYRWYDIWTFECAAIAAHPETGERTALGWWRTGSAPRSVMEYTDAHWSPMHWQDVTEAGEGR